MGRMAQYLTAEYKQSHPDLNVRVLDSYGPGARVLMPWYFLRTFLTLTGLCLTKRASVVHLNLAAHGSTVRKLLLMWLARFFGVPTLLHIHASKFIPFCESLGPGARRLLIASLSRASLIVVIGDYWKKYLVDSLGVPENIVTVIHNAVPVGPAEPPTKFDRGGDCRIVALGLLGPRKGTPELLEALASPRLRSLPWHAVIAGNGEVDAARKLALDAGIADRVEIPGWVDASAVASILAAADIFVLPSHHEGLPVSILEAMSAGLPVVTTPVGAIPELVLAGETGLLIPPGSASALADALAVLVQDPTLRRKFGQAARARVEQSFRIEGTAARFVDLYRRLAARP
jgi:glycosyltransferase involved in cell wall biosynthesis